METPLPPLGCRQKPAPSVVKRDAYDDMRGFDDGLMRASGTLHFCRCLSS